MNILLSIILLLFGCNKINLEAKHKPTPQEIKEYNNRLINVSKEGDAEEVDQLLEVEGVDVNVVDENSNTPLHLASQNGYSAVVKRLLKAGADLNIKNKNGQTPFYLASQKGHEAVVKLLIAEEKKITNKLLLKASKAGDTDKVFQLLAMKGIDVNVVEEVFLVTPLHEAASRGHEAIVAQLLAAGANINAKDKIGLIPLNHASMCGHKIVVDQLSAAETQLKIKENSNKLLKTLNTDDTDKIFQLLATKDIDVNIVDERLVTPLHIAAKRGHEAIVDQLLAVGANVNAEDNTGWTPLHEAARFGHEAIIAQLLAAGANINAESIDGTPLKLAFKNSHEAAVSQLTTIKDQLVLCFVVRCISQNNFANLDFIIYNCDKWQVDINNVIISLYNKILPIKDDKQVSPEEYSAYQAKGRRMLIGLLLSVNRYIKDGKTLSSQQRQMLQILLKPNNYPSLLRFSNGTPKENKMLLCIILHIFELKADQDLMMNYLSEFGMIDILKSPLK